MKKKPYRQVTCRNPSEVEESGIKKRRRVVKRREVCVEGTWGESASERSDSVTVKLVNFCAVIGIFALAIGGYFALKNIFSSEYSTYENKEVKDEYSNKEEAMKQLIRKGTLLHAVTQFVTAKECDDVAGMIRHQERVKPFLASYYHENRVEVAKWKLEGVDKEIRREGEYVIVKLKGENLPSEILILEQKEESWLVDWESFVVHQEIPWEEIKSDLNQDPILIRAVIRPIPENKNEYLATDPVRKKSLVLSDVEGLFKGNLLEKTKGVLTLRVEVRGGEVVPTQVTATGWVIKKSQIEETVSGGLNVGSAE